MVVGDKSAITSIELTVPFELCVDSAVARKTERYSELLGTCRDVGYNANLLTLEVSSRGFIHTDSFDYQSFPATRAKQEMARTCLLQSFRFWCKHNWKEPATSHVATTRTHCCLTRPLFVFALSVPVSMLPCIALSFIIMYLV